MGEAKTSEEVASVGVASVVVVDSKDPSVTVVDTVAAKDLMEAKDLVEAKESSRRVTISYSALRANSCPSCFQHCSRISFRDLKKHLPLMETNDILSEPFCFCPNSLNNQQSQSGS